MNCGRRRIQMAATGRPHAPHILARPVSLTYLIHLLCITRILFIYSVYTSCVVFLRPTVYRVNTNPVRTPRLHVTCERTVYRIQYGIVSVPTRYRYRQQSARGTDRPLTILRSVSCTQWKLPVDARCVAFPKEKTLREVTGRVQAVSQGHRRTRANRKRRG